MIVIPTKYGYMCNRIFTFAHVIAFCIENGLTVINPAFGEYSKFFTGTKENLLCQYPPRKLFFINTMFLRRFIYYVFYQSFRISKTLNLIIAIDIGWRDNFRFDDPNLSTKVTRIKEDSVAFLGGLYFKDPVSFRKHAGKIRNFFQPLEVYRTNVSNLIEDMRENYEIIIGVHIRQGDYVNFANGLLYYKTEEYVHIMQSIEKLFPLKSITFLICSNVKQDETMFKNLSCRFGNGHIIEDLYSLAQCDYIIGPSSSYSKWASFYGEVPIYIINKKWQEFEGLETKDPEIEDFKVFYPSIDPKVTWIG